MRRRSTIFQVVNFCNGISIREVVKNVPFFGQADRKGVLGCLGGLKHL